EPTGDWCIRRIYSRSNTPEAEAAIESSRRNPNCESQMAGAAGSAAGSMEKDGERCRCSEFNSRRCGRTHAGAV
ncbi:hypothetical protein E4U31_000415, partial [Claviceps sp. LM219 group G6]